RGGDRRRRWSRLHLLHTVSARRSVLHRGATRSRSATRESSSRMLPAPRRIRETRWLPKLQTTIRGGAEMSTTKRSGVVIDRPDLTILDTRQMEWEEFSGLEGARIKVLSRDDDGEPSVFLVWLPPGRLISD